MYRRIAAWAILVLFALLLANIFVFGIYVTESVYLYAMIVAMFFVVNALKGRVAESNPQSDGEGGTEDGSEEEGREPAPEGQPDDRNGNADRDGYQERDSSVNDDRDGIHDRDGD